MKNLKFFFNKNIILIVSLIVLFIGILNYENIMYFFKLKEGNTNKRTAVNIEAEITEKINSLLTTEETGSNEKIKWKEFFLDNTIKGSIIELFNLNTELILKKNNATYNSFKNNIESISKTRQEFKNLLQKSIPTLALYSLGLKIYKDNGIDLMGELDILNSSNNIISNTNDENTNESNTFNTGNLGISSIF